MHGKLTDFDGRIIKMGIEKMDSRAYNKDQNKYDNSLRTITTANDKLLND